MAFSDLTESLDNTCVSLFGIPAMFQPQTGGPAILINGIMAPPPLAEEILPAGPQGVAVVRFFVRYVDIEPNPTRGDTIDLTGIVYDIFDVDVDVVGGAVLKLRKAR